ncbi:alpha-galactosidase, partial [Sesbania bispinosa]
MDCRRPPFPQQHSDGSNSQVLSLCRRRAAACSARAPSLTHSGVVFSEKEWPSRARSLTTTVFSDKQPFRAQSLAATLFPSSWFSQRSHAM